MGFGQLPRLGWIAFRAVYAVPTLKASRYPAELILQIWNRCLMPDSQWNDIIQKRFVVVANDFNAGDGNTQGLFVP